MLSTRAFAAAAEWGVWSLAGPILTSGSQFLTTTATQLVQVQGTSLILEILEVTTESLFEFLGIFKCFFLVTVQLQVLLLVVLLVIGGGSVGRNMLFQTPAMLHLATN